MTYTVTITEESGGATPITIEYNATNIASESGYGNANVASYLAANTALPITTTANVTAGAFVGSGAGLTGISVSGSNVTGAVANATYATTAGSATSAGTANVATVAYSVAAGNISGIIANATYANTAGSATTANTANAVAGANVSGTVANATYATTAGSATTATSATTASTAGTANIALVAYSVAAGNIVGTVANATYSDTAGSATVANSANAVAGANVSGTVANATYATTAGSATTATSATTAGTVTTAAQPNITSVGTLSDLSIGGNAVINGNLTVNGDTVYTNITSFGVEDPVIEMGRGANGDPLVSNDGKDRGERLWYYSGSEKSAFAGYDNSAGKMILATDVSITDEVVTVNAFGNTQVGNLDAVNVVATTFTGSGSGLTSIPAANISGTVANATYSDTAGTATSATTAGTVTTAAQPNITSVGTLSSLSVTGNVETSGYFLGDGSQLTNLPTTTPGGNTSEVQFNNAGSFAGDSLFTWDTGNAIANIANVNIQGTRINNTTAYAVPTNTVMNPGQLLIGNGVDGNVDVNMDFFNRARNARLGVWGSHQQSGAAAQSTGFAAQETVTLTADWTNTNSRAFAMSGVLQIGGQGTYNSTSKNILNIAAQTGVTIIGNQGNSQPGNTTVEVACGTTTGVQVSSGSNANNTVGFASLNISGGTIGNAIGYIAGTVGGVSPSGEYIAYLVPSSTNNYGTTTSNTFRQASGGYWAFKNDDAVATVQLGSLKQYHEFTDTSNSTSGNITIDKTLGQVQQITPSANITIDGFENFVTTATNGSTTYNQTDTVTLTIVNTGGYDITMPTGSEYKYSGNTSTVGNTAGSVTLISVSAIDISSTTTYLITISPEFV